MMRGALLAATAILVVIAACGDDDGGAPGKPASRSFDPSKYRKDCATAADCIEVATITDCALGCCESIAVRRETAEADYDAVDLACSQKTVCTKLCADNAVACTNGQCTATPIASDPEP